MEQESLSVSSMNNNNEPVSAPVIQTEFLETMLKQQHMPEPEAQMPPGTTSFLDEEEEEVNPLLNEEEKEVVNPPNLLPVFLLGGAVLFAGGYLIYKYWPCSSPVLEATEAMTTQ